MSYTYNGEEPVRVNKWMGQTGVCSRREAEALIQQGLVFIDGEQVADVGRKIQTGQTLTFAGQAVTQLETRLSVIINKPAGIVSAHPDANYDQVPAVDLLTPANLVGQADALPDGDSRLAPVGRLDQDSRGLLVLSEDGVLAKALIGPESGLEKEYLVSIEGIITDWMLDKLRYGLVLDGRQLRPADVTVIGKYRLRFVLREGRNRQIRRMCEAVGLYVTDLVRIRIGTLSLGDLPEGKWRMMTSGERADLIETIPPQKPLL
jgi:23S rRNA pseudouridine2604 synthase